MQRFDFKKSSIKKAEKKCHGVPSDDGKFLLYVAVCRPGAGPNHPRFKGYLLTLPYPGSGFIF